MGILPYRRVAHYLLQSRQVSTQKKHHRRCHIAALNPANWSLLTSIILFVIAAIIIGLIGWRQAELVDRLADRTGMGEAIAGALFLGASTSLPGIITSVTTAANGYPELAVSNALGGIAVQTVFLVAADAAYRKANLEHAAASAANIMQGTLLITLLAIPILATTSPPFHIWGINPASPFMIIVYVYGLQMVQQARNEPMWRPRQTAKMEEDVPDEEAAHRQSLVGMWVRFAIFAVIIGAAGWVVGRTGEVISDSTGLSQTVVGGLFTAVSTSLPELVTSVSAVRQGALTLAVSGIIGGNAFDTLFVAVSDVAYREGSIYHAITEQQIFLMALTGLLVGILLMGLIRRQERGIGNIGFESFMILVLYLGAVALLFFS
ncbi:MAG: sodium:calcium antiporter [Chloroflexaceae bacterium]